LVAILNLRSYTSIIYLGAFVGTISKPYGQLIILNGLYINLLSMIYQGIGKLLLIFVVLEGDRAYDICDERVEANNLVVQKRGGIL